MRKLLLTLMLGIFLIGMSSAFLGTFRQGECVEIRDNANTTAINLTTLWYPNSTIAVQDAEMTRRGYVFNYTFCGTESLGKYTYDFCYIGGECFVNDFEVTPSGTSDTTGFYWFIILVSLAIIVLGFYLLYPYIVLMGTIGLYFVGLQFIRYGFANRQDVSVIAIATVILGLAAIISIKTILEVIQENYG